MAACSAMAFLAVLAAYSNSYSYSCLYQFDDDDCFLEEEITGAASNGNDGDYEDAGNIIGKTMID